MGSAITGRLRTSAVAAQNEYLRRDHNSPPLPPPLPGHLPGTQVRHIRRPNGGGELYDVIS